MVCLSCWGLSMLVKGGSGCCVLPSTATGQVEAGGPGCTWQRLVPGWDVGSWFWFSWIRGAFCAQRGGAGLSLQGPEREGLARTCCRVNVVLFLRCFLRKKPSSKSPVEWPPKGAEPMGQGTG